MELDTSGNLTVAGSVTDGDGNVLGDSLTASDVQDIKNAFVVPTTSAQMPILFDETGAEYIVGWYKLANGTKKPVYQKTFSISETQLTAGQWTVLNSIDCSALNMNELLGAQFFNISSGNSIVRSYVSGSYMPGTTIYLRAFNPISTNVAINNVTIQYTKTTDTPV